MRPTLINVVNDQPPSDTAEIINIVGVLVYSQCSFKVCSKIIIVLKH